MKIRPLYDRIVVKRIEQQEQKHGRPVHPRLAPKRSPRKAK